MTPEAVAEAAITQWGTPAKPLRFLKNRENAVFEVHLTNGTHAALRLHRAGYQTTQSIASELLWTQRLHAKGFPCPRPIENTAGDLIHILENGTATSLIEWLPGDPIGLAGEPFQGTPKEQLEIYHALGKLLADLHRLTDQPGTTDTITRPSWGFDALLGDDPFWNRFWENPALTPKEQSQARALRQWARAYLSARDWDMGLIHADAIQENVLNDAGPLSLIDFDDSGYGYRPYDLGAALSQHVDNPMFADLRAALIDGYGPTKRLTEDTPVFTLLRTMASAGWIITRTDDQGKLAHYGQRMLRHAMVVAPEAL